MKRFCDSILNLEDGWIIIVKKNDCSSKNYYSGFLTKYDEDIFKDIMEIEDLDFLNLLPYIKDEITNNTYYRLAYDFNEKVYESSIVRSVEDKVFKNKIKEEVVDCKISKNRKLIDGIYDLENSLAYQKNKSLKKIKNVS